MRTIYAIYIDDDNAAIIQKTTDEMVEALYKQLPHEAPYCVTSDEDNAWEIADHLNHDYLGCGKTRYYA